MKKFLFLIAFIMYMFLCTNIAMAEDIPRPELVDLANRELIEAEICRYEYFNKEKNWGGRELSTNEHLEGMRNLIVYGEPFEIDAKTGRNRYLGYTMEDTFFTNYLFRNDATSPIGLYNRNWIEDPKNNPDTKNEPKIKDSQGDFDNNPYYEESIRLGLKRISRIDSNGNLIDFPDEELVKREWYKYVHIYQPPTSVSWGSGIMFHKDASGKIWYVTVPLDPDGIDPPDIDSGSINASLTATVTPEVLPEGETGTVTITLNSSDSMARLNGQPVDITTRRYRVEYGNQQSVGGEEITFTVDNVRAGSTITCSVEVFSQALEDAGVEPRDEESINIYIGTRFEASIGSSFNSKAVLGADERDNEKFNVLQKIPVKESLYANITKVPEYLVNAEYELVKRTKKYEVTVSRKYDLEWKERRSRPVTEYDEEGNIIGTRTEYYWSDRSDTETVRETYTIERQYQYYSISRLEVFGLDGAVIYNDCLPNDSINLTPKGYNLPEITVVRSEKESDHIKEPTFRKKITLEKKTLEGGKDGKPTLPSSNWKGKAEDEVGKIIVKNDLLKIDGITFLNDKERNSFTDAPNNVKLDNPVGKNVLFEHKDSVVDNELTIGEDVLNGTYESRGEVYYRRIENINGTLDEIITQEVDVNPVTIHAPVVCDPKIQDDKGFNQELDTDKNVASVILGRASSLTFPTQGGNKFQGFKGYNADFEKYTKERIAKFPFDVYIGKNMDGEYLPVGESYVIPEGKKEIDFYVPVWVDEGEYNVEFKAIAINSPYGDSLSEKEANRNIENYVAVNTVPVKVIGRVYGFKITDINDYPDWEEVFRERSGTSEHTGKYYWVGNNNENGQKVRDDEKFTLPVLNGSHTRIENLGVLKTGYKIRFDLTTIGNCFTEDDFIRIRPSFYYVNKDGTGRREVDLWYMERIEGKDSIVKVGSKLDEKNIRTMVLGDSHRNVTSEEIETTAEIVGMSESELRNRETQIGYYSKVILHKPIRTFIGDTYVGGTENIPWEVDEERVKKSVQKWYGEYNVPNTVFVCDEGCDVLGEIGKRGTFTGDEDYWLKNGYIVVNFDIEVLRRIIPESGNDYDIRRFSYWGSENCDMWKVEGFSNEKSDSEWVRFNLQSGDVIFYYTDERSTSDYRVQ
jgi:hypothetical protein